MQDLKILYEDNHIIVVVKPAGIPVQQDKTSDLDMLTIIKAYLKEKYNKPGNVYLGLVHRLDRMVGGVMVFAKTSKAASRISEYIRQKNVKKRYLAIVNGKMDVTGDVVELKDYLVKNERLNMSRVVDKSVKGSKESILEYKVIKNFKYNNKEYSLVDIDLHTGRHHQIRVQLSSRNHSIYGDQKYGGRGHGKQICLWAYELTINHPITKEEMTFKSIPKMEKSWKILEDIKLSLIHI